MLDAARPLGFTAATNLKRRTRGAAWTFLLPSLELERILCLAPVAPTTLATLERLGETIVVADGRSPADLGPQTVDLLVVGRGREGRRLARRGGLSPELGRLLKPSGVVYAELGILPLLAPRRVPAGTLLALAPVAGEVQTAVPASDARTRAYLRRHPSYRPGFGHRALEQAHIPVAALLRRRGLLVGVDPHPPRWLRSLAEESGAELGSGRWALAARGRYLSKKILLLLFEDGSAEPSLVVKIARDPSCNDRLESERRGLRLLGAEQPAFAAAAPRIRFFGYHGGLAVLGQTAVAGEVLAASSRVEESGRAAIQWLLELGLSSVRSVSPESAADRLSALLDRFAALYAPAEAEHDFLRRQVARVAASLAPFPLVFQHGDPHTRNVLVGPDGRPAFLDWEAADPAGFPLWDLFYLARGWGARSSRDPVDGYRRAFLEDREPAWALAAAVAEFSRRGGLRAELVEPLLHFCWLHRALKEAARLPAGRLEQGTFVRLLRLCIAEREAPGLRRVFSAGAGGR